MQKDLTESLREHTMEMMLWRKKKKLLTKEQQEIYENAKIYYICREKFEDKHVKDKKYCKVRDHFHYTCEYRGAAHNICNLKYNVPKEIPIVFHNGPNYDYHFIVKELPKEFEKQFTCLVKNIEKDITFTVPIEKGVKRTDKMKLQKPYLTDYNLLIVQSLWQADYQILWIISLKEFIKLNVNTDMIIKNAKRM